MPKGWEGADVAVPLSYPLSNVPQVHLLEELSMPQGPLQKSGVICSPAARLFGNSGACSACGQSIPASELVMRAQGNVYHLKCFTCSTCRNRLVPGDRFHYINGSLFCEHDRPTALINGHLNSLQSNPLLPDQKVC
nr:LIM domain transcription factor LMO4 isoform X2 [Gorilla gorilla gorilla]